jgi:SAM-dependent methyltransferase
MRISAGLKDEGIIVGNYYDKYGTRNPVARRIVKGFEDALSTLVVEAEPRSIHEIGCGEGYWVLRWRKKGISARGSDVSGKVIDLARANARMDGLDPDIFETRSIYNMEPGRDSADLIVCCEVLEHLERPEDGLRALQKTANHHVIVSVPREPLWRLLNMLRCKYWHRFGNTPGHLQHWSRRGFVELVSRYFEILDVKSPLPWTIILCRRRHQDGTDAPPTEKQS